MSPQMKAILLSFKNLPFERNSSKDVEVLDSLDGEEKFVDFPSSSSSWRNKVSFSRIPDNSQSCQVEKNRFNSSEREREDYRRSDQPESIQRGCFPSEEVVGGF